MTKPDMILMTMVMMAILIMNLLTDKTSLMCLNLIFFIMFMTMIMSMKIKLTPIPFIVFLTMIGGLMIIFLYLTATLWTKKEKLTMNTKIIYMMLILIPPLFKVMALAPPLPNEIKMFKYNMNKMTMLLIIILTLMLIYTIEIHMKMNSPFRRKLKIWD